MYALTWLCLTVGGVTQKKTKKNMLLFWQLESIAMDAALPISSSKSFISMEYVSQWVRLVVIYGYGQHDLDYFLFCIAHSHYYAIDKYLAPLNILNFYFLFCYVSLLCIINKLPWNKIIIFKKKSATPIGPIKNLDTSHSCNFIVKHFYLEKLQNNV